MGVRACRARGPATVEGGEEGAINREEGATNREGWGVTGTGSRSTIGTAGKADRCEDEDEDEGTSHGHASESDRNRPGGRGDTSSGLASVGGNTTASASRSGLHHTHVTFSRNGMNTMPQQSQAGIYCDDDDEDGHGLGGDAASHVEVASVVARPPSPSMGTQNS